MAQTSRKPELLIPANSLEVLKIAVIYGADAVYVGGEAYGLRAKARNFSMEELREGIAFAHEHGVRVYVTANILAHNQDLEGVRAYFQELREIKPDALIISDPGVYDIACEICPEIERHISTQANNTNYGSYLFWHRLGAKRVVSARELSLEEIREIRRRYGDRELHPRSHVHFLFRQVPAQQLFHREGCQPGGLYPPLPLEVCSGGGTAAGRISAGL